MSKEENIHFRCTAEEKKMIAELAKGSDRSIGNYILYLVKKDLNKTQSNG